MIPWGDDMPLARRPIVTYVLVSVNLAVLAYLAPKSGYAAVVETYGFSPEGGTPLLVLAALFLPGTVTYLLFNGLFLVGIGRTVEDTIGRPAYLLYYLVGGTLALGAYFLVHPAGTVPIVALGASTGAILAAYVVLFPRAQIRFMYWAWYWEGSVFVPAWTCITGWVVIEAILGYRGFALHSAYPVAHWASLLGAGSGALLALPLRTVAAHIAAEMADQEPGTRRLPALVQQHAQAQWRQESTTSGEIKPDREEPWADRIESTLREERYSQAIRLFERHGDPQSMERLQPATRYGLATACLEKGRYWRAVPLLESLLGSGSPPKLQVKARMLLAALYGEHAFFHASAKPHLDAVLATLPPASRTRALLLEVQKKVEAGRERDLYVGERDRFCLVRETDAPYRIADAGPIVAKATQRALPEVLRELRNNPGILAWKVPRQLAFDLAATLGYAGIGVGIVPLAALMGYSKVEPLEHVSVKIKGLELRTVSETLRVPWNNLALITGGFLVLTSAQQQRVYEEALHAQSEAGEPTASFDSLAQELRHLTMLDFWVKSPQRHLRVREHPLRMPEAQLQAIASTILRCAPAVKRNAGLNAVASGVVPPECLFDGRDHFTYHGTWHLFLQKWEELPRVSDSLIHNLMTLLAESD